MGQRPSDKPSILWASAALWKLGIPDLRPCQGNASLEKQLASQTYRRTPDLVAGPVEGNGSRRDFYIDVAELQGETLYNPRRPGGTHAPPILRDPARNPGTFKVADMPRNHFDGYLSTLNGKLRKYSTERGNSPMVGLCVHLDASAMRSGATLDPKDMLKFAARFDYPRFLESVFAPHAGRGLHEAFARLLGPDIGPAILFFPMPFAFTFILHTVKLAEASDLRVLLLVNDGVLDGEFRDHAVLGWLRRLRDSASTAAFEPVR